MKQRDDGFTLIELLIVIVILGILATVVVFAVGGITDTGQSAACDADQRTLEVAVEAYFTQQDPLGSYPATTDDLVPGFLRSVPQYYEVAPAGDGTIQLTAAGGTANCTAP